jgi:hypothetical protein
MSRFDDLKKQYPHLNMSLLDVFNKLDPTTTYKYVPLFCKILGKRFNLKEVVDANGYEYTARLEDLLGKLQQCGISSDGMTSNEIFVVCYFLDWFSENDMDILKNFISHMEQGLIENKDVTSYKDIASIQMATSLANLKSTEKEMEGQIQKDFEDDTWLIVRPLTFEASLKYGYGTKWCTTMERNKEHFARYWRQGIVAYIINKKNGVKYALYKDLFSSKELSFWDMVDDRRDFLELEIDSYLIPIIKNIIKDKKTNKDLCGDELAKMVEKSCMGNLRDISEIRHDEEPYYAEEPVLEQPITYYDEIGGSDTDFVGPPNYSHNEIVNILNTPNTTNTTNQQFTYQLDYITTTTTD